jgi:hypothetical protein
MFCVTLRDEDGAFVFSLMLILLQVWFIQLPSQAAKKKHQTKHLPRPPPLPDPRLSRQRLGIAWKDFLWRLDLWY